MVLKMYCLYDRKTEFHHPPLYAHNTGHALRVFGDMFANPQLPFGKHPEDYQVFEVGSFDDQTATVLPVERPHLIAAGTELMVDKPLVDTATEHQF